MLFDRLVCGIDNGPIQCQLLAEPALTLDKAIELSLAMESTDRNAKELQKTQHPQAINALKHQSPFSASPTSTKTVKCFCCGRAHFATSSHFKDNECRLCKKKRHIACICHSKKAAEPGKAPPTQHKAGATSKKTGKGNFQPTHSVESAGTTGNDIDACVYTLLNTASSPSKPFVVTLQIDGAELPMEVDTGASMILISKATFDKLWDPQNVPSLQLTSSKLQTYTGENIEVRTWCC